MKKIIMISITLLLLLTGCSDKGKNNDVLNHDELMAGDFSSIAGEYVNPAGKVIVIDDRGTMGNETVESEMFYSEEYGYHRRIRGEEVDSGIVMNIYPIGVEVNEFVETDTTKIRIGYGNGSPINDETIFTKK